MIIIFSNVLGPVQIDCVLREAPENRLDITEIPVETGSRITDHAIIAPKKVTLEIANHNASMSYQNLVAFQETRVPFTVVTGLSVFNNMLISGISAVRDATMSRVLSATIDLQEVILVDTAYDPKAGGAARKGTKAKKGQSNSSQNTSDKTSSVNNTGTTGGQSPGSENRSTLHRFTRGNG